MSACPFDVWVDGELGFVHFDLAFPDFRPGWLVFAVNRADGRLVAAKLLRPDERGENLVISDVAEAVPFAPHLVRDLAEVRTGR